MGWEFEQTKANQTWTGLQAGKSFRIWIHMDLHSFSKLDPPKKLDPDPHTVNADLKHGFAIVDSVFLDPVFFHKYCRL
jgi:hypothetical protein